MACELVTIKVFADAFNRLEADFLLFTGNKDARRTTGCTI